MKSFCKKILIAGTSQHCVVQYSVKQKSCLTSIYCTSSENGECLIFLSAKPKHDWEDNGVISTNGQHSLIYQLNHSTVYYIQVSMRINSTVSLIKGNFTTMYYSKYYNNEIKS